MSAFLMVELTIRSVDSRRSSLARIASLTALLMSSRSIVLSSRRSFNHLIMSIYDLGGSCRSDNLDPQPFDQSFRGCLRLFLLRQVAAIRKHHQFRPVGAVSHLHRGRIRNGVGLVPAQDQRWPFDAR